MPTCETCGKSFDTIGRLKSHNRLAHGDHPRRKGPDPMTETKKAEANEQKQTQTQPDSTETPNASQPVLTSEERALVDQITRSKPDWSQITEDDLLDFSLAEDPFKLPAEAKQRQDRKEMAYRWCERTPKRVAELTNANPPLKWWVANSTTAPYLQKHVDPTIGGVCRLDQILLLKPWNMHQKVKDAVASSAKALYNSRELTKGGAQKVQAHDSTDHLKVVTGDRAHVKGSDMMYEGEHGGELGELVAAD